MIDVFDNYKQCSVCMEIKLLTAFRWRNDTKKYRNNCVECGKVAERNRREQNRKNNIDKVEGHGVKKCYKCKEIKDLVLFSKNKTKVDGHGSACLECDKKEKENNRLINKTNLNRRARERRKENPEYHKNKDKQRYYSNKLRRLFSVIVRSALSKQGVSKKGQSAFALVPYTLEELKNHIENRFEWWMTWDNYGRYIENEWNDNDPLTWKWNIDHIIPQSFFKFNAPTDKEFLECWSLENLRPYNAKSNVKDQNKRSIEEINKIKGCII